MKDTFQRKFFHVCFQASRGFFMAIAQSFFLFIFFILYCILENTLLDSNYFYNSRFTLIYKMSLYKIQ